MIFTSWSTPKTDLQTNFLNLKIRSFENVSFSQQELFKQIFDILLLIDLFIYFIDPRNILQGTQVKILFR